MSAPSGSPASWPITPPAWAAPCWVAPIALTGPVTEELMFRGLLLGGLLSWWTRCGASRPSRLQLAAAVLVIAAAFAAVHGLLDPNSWRAVPAITVGGVVYGAIVVRDGTSCAPSRCTPSPTASPWP